jgi:hypothetical protein
MTLGEGNGFAREDRKIDAKVDRARRKGRIIGKTQEMRMSFPRVPFVSANEDRAPSGLSHEFNSS